MAATIYKADSKAGRPVPFVPHSEIDILPHQTTSSNPPPRRGVNTYAQKIAALQSANENDIKMTLTRSLVNVTGSGFVPPVLMTSGDKQVILENPKLIQSGYMSSSIDLADEATDTSSVVSVASIASVLPLSAMMSIPSHQVAPSLSVTPSGYTELPRPSAQLGSSIPDITVISIPTDKGKDMETITITKDIDDDSPINLCRKDSLEKQESVSHKYDSLPSALTVPLNVVQLHGSPGVAPSTTPVGMRIMTGTTSSPLTCTTSPLTSPSSSSPQSLASQVQYVTSENRAPFEIIPIPGKVTDPTESLIDGRYVCNICKKTFPKYHQLSIHKNIHFFERPFRCDDCGISFRTKGHLLKHQRSENHVAKISMNQQFGVPSTDNPRPYKCEDCNVAFRIHGHLAKHLRSKLHITTLEKLGKVPAGTYEQIEKNSLGEIDATDCDTSLESLQHIVDPEGILPEAGGKRLAMSSPSKDSVDSEGSAGMPIDIPTPTSSSTTRKEATTTTVSGSLVHEPFQFLGDYEHNAKASNERVTVEMKSSEPFDISSLSRRERFRDRYEEEGDGSQKSQDKTRQLGMLNLLVVNYQG